MITDSVGNALTKIRNAVRVRHPKVTVSTNKLIIGVLDVLKDKGFIGSYELETLENKMRVANITLKYSPNPSIVEITRMSKPGRRMYVNCNHIPRVYNGLGIAILSTSKGIMSDKEAKKQNIGGELVCTVF
jgi:small subunit ribosomal protein S8